VVQWASIARIDAKIDTKNQVRELAGVILLCGTLFRCIWQAEKINFLPAAFFFAGRFRADGSSVSCASWESDVTGPVKIGHLSSSKMGSSWIGLFAFADAALLCPSAGTSSAGV
jgi:hypothetical protein